MLYSFLIFIQIYEITILHILVVFIDFIHFMLQFALSSLDDDELL